MYEMRTERKIGGKWVILIASAVVIAIIATLAVSNFDKTHFGNSTTINGIDCSNLSIEEATEKLIEEANKPITFVTVLPNKQGSKEYVSEKGQFDLQLSEEVDLKELLERQNEDKSQIDFVLENPFTVNEKAVEEYLQTIPELNGENIVQAENAYLSMKDDFVVIVPEVYGNRCMSGDDFWLFAISLLQSGASKVDYSEIIYDPPRIKSDERLKNYRDKLNTMLQTTINFELNNGKIVSLHDDIKTWVEGQLYSDTLSDVSLTIGLKEGITTFLEQLAKDVDEANSTMVFLATGIGNITLYVPKSLRPQLDIEAEVEQILKDLETGETIDRKPIYDKPFFNDNLTSYVELDITRQNVWAYVDGNNVLDTPCRTGNVSMGDGTPTGIYYLAYKTRGATLRGYNYDGSIYNSYVEYWMPFNGGIGFHDAYWVHVFGGNAYLTQGSHGCVNLPLEAAATLYQYINTDMPIFVYKS